MLSLSTPSYAALDVGDAAPNFTATAALGGKQFKFTLAESLAKGPVVLYFFPAAFSVGCSIEAHEFAEAINRFQALGATVIGVSSDDIETLSKFSVQACQGKFPVASDHTQQVMKSYDAVMALRPRLREPHLVRDRAGRQGDLQLPEPEPEPARREDAGRTDGLGPVEEVIAA
jgi:peroxiredoxin